MGLEKIVLALVSLLFLTAAAIRQVPPIVQGTVELKITNKDKFLADIGKLRHQRRFHNPRYFKPGTFPEPDGVKKPHRKIDVNHL